jgi:uncharacterized protein (TIGR03083 family)
VVALGNAYLETKLLLLTAAGPLDSVAWSTPVPATPEWNVLDIVAHVTGIATDATAGTLPADLNLLEQFRDEDVVAARDEFADGQVLRRRDADPESVLTEWDRATPVLAELLDHQRAEPALPFAFDVVIVTDLCVHADDVAIALGFPPHRGTAAARVAVAGYSYGVDYRVRALGLPALLLRFDGKERPLGDGPQAATLTTDGWELLRVLAGRRSRAQIANMDWSGEKDEYLGLLPAYGERSDDLVEETEAS